MSIQKKLLDQLPERLASKVNIDETGCWLWTACVYPGGYGMYRHNGKLQRAHRVVYTLLVGEIPSGLQLDHLCRVRHCVNPEHLEPVTQRENLLRGDHPNHVANRTKICQRGHPITGKKCRECILHGKQRYRERKKLKS